MLPKEVPREAELANREGHHFVVSHDLERCKQLYERLFEEFPDFEPPYLNLARVYLWNGQVDQAKLLLRKVISINSDYVPAWLLLAEIHMALFEIQDAQDAIDRARDLFDDCDEQGLGRIVSSMARL